MYVCIVLYIEVCVAHDMDIVGDLNVPVAGQLLSSLWNAIKIRAGLQCHLA